MAKFNPQKLTPIIIDGESLLAMDLDRKLIDGAVRFAVGALTTEAEIDEAIERIGRVNAGLLAGRSG